MTETPWEWYLLTLSAGLAPVFVIGSVVISQETVREVARREYEEKQEILDRLPGWFPPWLYEQSTPGELRDYFSVIYWGGLSPEDIAKIPGRVYHATPNPEMIMREGFKTAAELGVSGFGGTGDYISTTTLENAMTYRDNLRMACRVINGEVGLRELKAWMREQAEGSDAPFERSFETAKHPLVYGRPPDPEIERLGLDYPPFNTPEFLWEVFDKGYTMDGPGYVLFIGKPTLLRKRCEDIGIVEAEPSPRLRFRHHYNIFRDTPMGGRYTYNRYEKQWRIWDSSDLKPLRIIGSSRAEKKERITPCDVCGTRREDWDRDWHVSDEAWERIVPEPYKSAPSGKGGLICPWCFVKFAQQRGEKYRVQFFNGIALGVMKEKEHAVLLFTENLLRYYGITSKMIVEEAWLPPPSIRIEEEPSIAYATYDWDLNQIIFHGEENVKLKHFLHEFYHMIQGIERGADKYRITPKYEKDMEQFKYGYKWMEEFDVGAERFVEAELPKWEREWRTVVE